MYDPKQQTYTKTEYDIVMDKNKRLKDFARPVIRQVCWSLFNLDGGDVQEWAEKQGLIVPHIATAEDVDDESDYGVGDKIYKFSELLQEKP